MLKDLIQNIVSSLKESTKLRFYERFNQKRKFELLNDFEND